MRFQRKYLLLLGICFLIVFLIYFVFRFFSLPFSFLEREKRGVLNHPPKVETRGVGTGCGIAGAEIFWYFSDPDPEDFITSYQVQLDDNSDFSHCPGPVCLFDSGKETDLRNLKKYDSTYKFNLSKELPEKVYFWRVKVWDSKDVSSPWASAILDLTQ